MGSNRVRKSPDTIAFSKHIDSKRSTFPLYMRQTPASAVADTFAGARYICPGGAELASSGNVDQGHIPYYRPRRDDCSTCSLKPECTTAVVRKVTRDVHEHIRDYVRAPRQTSFIGEI